MIKIYLLSLLVLTAAVHARAGSEDAARAGSEDAARTVTVPATSDDAAREKTLRTALEIVLTLSDEDYRDMAKSASADARWAKFDRSTFLQKSFKSLAASRRRRAAADRKSTRLNSSHSRRSRMPSSA